MTGPPDLQQGQKQEVEAGEASQTQPARAALQTHLSRCCSRGGTPRSGRRPCGGSVPGDRTGDTVPPPGGRSAPPRSSGSRPLRPRRTQSSWGHTSRTSRSWRYHSDCGEMAID